MLVQSKLYLSLGKDFYLSVLDKYCNELHFVGSEIDDITKYEMAHGFMNLGLRGIYCFENGEWPGEGSLEAVEYGDETYSAIMKCLALMHLLNNGLAEESVLVKYVQSENKFISEFAQKCLVEMRKEK